MALNGAKQEICPRFGDNSREIPQDTVSISEISQLQSHHIPVHVDLAVKYIVWFGLPIEKFQQEN